MVGVVVDDAYVGDLSFELEAAAHAPEVSQGARRLVGMMAEPTGHRCRCQRVEYIVAPVDAEFDLTPSLPFLKQHVTVRANDVGPEVA
jgi:hypothetical protein